MGVSVAIKSASTTPGTTEAVDGDFQTAVDWAAVGVELVPPYLGLPPAVGFSATPTLGVVPLAVSFTDESSGSPTAWLWEFGDGNTSTERHPQHTYASVGTYTVTLTAQNHIGPNTGTRVDYIQARSPVVTCDIVPTAASAVNQEVTFDVVSSGGVGQHEYAWSFGDQSGGTPPSTDPQSIHAFAAPGHYDVVATVTDGQATGVCSAPQTVHYPVSTRPPTKSGSIIRHAATGSIWNVNPDNQTVTAIDEQTLTVLFENVVGGKPTSLGQAPDGTVWVVNQDDATISVLDGSDGSVITTIGLPEASRPFGIAFSPDGSAGYVSLEAVGTLLRMNPVTRAVAGAVDVGPHPRGIAVSSDSTRIFVTRFISPTAHGDVTEVSGDGFTLVRTFHLAVDPGPDAEDGGRGVPNYLTSATISPDGRRLWVPSKKDNTERGLFRDGRAPTFDSTVRTIVSQLDLVGNTEVLSDRRISGPHSRCPGHALTPTGVMAIRCKQFHLPDL